MADEIQGAGGEEAGEGEGVGIVGVENVAGDLGADEAGVWHVVVEGADDGVAVGQGVGAGFIFIVAVGFAVVDDVEPVAGPPFAVAGRREELIDELFVGVGAGVGEEGGRLFESGREAVEVEIETANEGSAVGGGRGGKVRVAELLLDEAVEGGGLQIGEGAEGPPEFLFAAGVILRSLGDPAGQERDFGGGKGFAGFRHAGLCAGEGGEEEAGIGEFLNGEGVSGDEVGSGVAGLMAGAAALGEEGGDVALVADGLGGGEGSREY